MPADAQTQHPSRYNVLISGYGRCKDLASVQRTVQAMQDAGIPPNQATHGSLVAALIRCGELQRASFALRVRLPSQTAQLSRRLTASPT